MSGVCRPTLGTWLHWETNGVRCPSDAVLQMLSCRRCRVVCLLGSPATCAVSYTHLRAHETSAHL
eukprot:4578110-Alexandrium_andersonii.AAC.1